MKKDIRRQKVNYFKRWTRKKYASFNSIHKIVIISAISLNCSFVFKSQNVYSQVKSDSIQKVIELNEVGIISPAEVQTQELQKTLLQSVITKKEIEHAPVQSINQLLDQLPSLDIRQRGSFGTQADISFRGGNFDQTIFLLNGINITDPQTGHYTMNLPVSIDIIKRIEVFKNTSAFLFGTAPFSGAINVITQPDSVNKINLHFFAGMYGLLGGAIDIHLHTGKFKHLLSFDYSRSDGYRKNTDFDLLNTFYQGIGSFRKGKLEIQIGFNDKNYGANSFYSLKFPNQFEHTQTFISSIQWQSKGIVKWTPSLYYRYNFDCFELIRNQDKTKNNYHNNQVAGINVQTSFTSKIGKTSFSADVRVEDIVSTSLGEKLAQPKPVHNEEITYKYQKTRSIGGLSAAQRFIYKHFVANVSFLGQYYMDNKLFCFLPAVDFSYHFPIKDRKDNNVDLQIIASAAKTLRMPTFTDLYYHTGDIQGNKDLKPEKAYTVETGMELELAKKGQLSYFRFKTDVFCRWGIDMIDYVKENGDSLWRAVNHTDIFFTGIESSMEFFPENLKGKNTFIKFIKLNYMYLYSNKKNDDFLSRYVLDHLTHKITFTFSHSIYKTWGMQYIVSYNLRKGEYMCYTNSIKGELTPYPPYTLLDLRMYYSMKNIYLYIEATNVLNVTYYDIGGLDQAGIWFKGGIKYKINLQRK